MAHLPSVKEDTIFFAPFTWNFITLVAISERRPTNTNNRDDITEVAEGLSQESAMYRLIIAGIMIALMLLRTF
jgi:hypothetical protein